MTLQDFSKKIDDCKHWIDNCWDPETVSQARDIARTLFERFDRQFERIKDLEQQAIDEERHHREAEELDSSWDPPPEGTYPNPQIVRDPSWEPRHPLDPGDDDH